MQCGISGASKQLGTIIEGESLLNDGAAIVLFNVFLVEMQPGQSQTGKHSLTHSIDMHPHAEMSLIAI